MAFIRKAVAKGVKEEMTIFQVVASVLVCISLISQGKNYSWECKDS